MVHLRSNADTWYVMWYHAGKCLQKYYLLPFAPISLSPSPISHPHDKVDFKSTTGVSSSPSEQWMMAGVQSWWTYMSPLAAARTILHRHD